MICERCGVVNRAGRTTCIHCLGPLKGGTAAEGLYCAEHPSEPATGKCVTCGKLVCEHAPEPDAGTGPLDAERAGGEDPPTMRVPFERLERTRVQV